MHVPRWHWPSFKVRTLMAITAVFALVFYVLAEMNRITLEQRWDIEAKWVRNPLKARFLPSEGASVRPGDPLLKVAQLGGGWGHAGSWLVTEGGKIGDTWIAWPDAGGNPEISRATGRWPQTAPDLLEEIAAFHRGRHRVE